MRVRVRFRVRVRVAVELCESDRTEKLARVRQPDSVVSVLCNMNIAEIKNPLLSTHL